MTKKLIAAILAVLIGLPALYFGATTLFISGSQDDISDTAEETNIASCEQIKQSSCATGEVTESDYPDSCFQEGQHVLGNPYQCSN